MKGQTKYQAQQLGELIEVSKKVIRDSRADLRTKKKDVDKRLRKNKYQKNRLMGDDSSEEENETSDNNNRK